MREIAISKSSSQTQKIAFSLARQLLKLKPAKKAVVIGLVGDLGSGKTVFAKGFAKGLGVKEIIASPTFVLMKIYSLPARLRYDEVVAGGRVARYAHFIHIDAYRLENSKELIDLGIKELIRDSRNIILIEWADKVKKIIPQKSILIRFETLKKNQRKICIKINKNSYGEK